MEHGLRPIPVLMWRSAAGREPVRDWFRALDVPDRAVMGDDLRRLQFGWPVGMSLVRSMGGGIWELRSSLPSKREARVLIAVDGERIAVLHGFIKKSRTTPQNDLNLARKRYAEVKP